MKYFDYAATTPLDKDSAEIYVKMATEYYGNTSSLHDIGGLAYQMLENCRDALARMLSIEKSGLYFTSGGSEGNFLAIEALLTVQKKQGNHIITTMAEHSSIHSSLKRLENNGYHITYLPLNSKGIVCLETLKQAIQEDTVLITIQHTNSEIGTIQPLVDIAKICHQQNILIHTDYVQGFGKSDVKELAKIVSSFSFSSHKFYGPKGCGGLYIQPSLKWSGFFPGTSHESGMRPGTVNLPAVAAMTVAAEKVITQTKETENKFIALREAFIHSLEPIREKVTIFGSEGAEQSPGIVGISIEGIEGQWLMLECNRLGYAISTGSACSAGLKNPSKTMQAIGLSGKKAKEFARISFGRTSSTIDVEKLGHHIVNITRSFFNQSKQISG